MPAQLIDGKALAARVRGEVGERARALAARGVTPGLAVVLVGDDPASQVYVRSKTRAAAEVGVRAFDHKLPGDTPEAELLALVGRLNEDPAVDGILVQFPVPPQIRANAVLDTIDPRKDVDGLTPSSIGLLSQTRPRFVAATPRGCMRILAETGVDPAGKHAVVIGRSNLVGRPVGMLLTNANATVTLCHSRTADLPGEVKRADIVVAAVGRARMVTADWLKPGAVVIDVGMNRDEHGKLCGDVDFASAREVAGWITPVPGGVGPMTIASLLDNTVLSAELRADGTR